MRFQKIHAKYLFVVFALIVMAGLWMNSPAGKAEAGQDKIYSEGERDGKAYINPAFNESLVNLSEVAIPTVVSIAVSQSVKLNIPSGQDEPFNDFFDHFFRRQMPNGQPFKRRGVGSGFIINPQGYILTNNHVVEGADEITVRLSDKEEYPGKVIGTDARTDIALIKIEGPKNLPYLKLGDSDALRIGEIVVAVGNPLGLSHTVTQGIVSQKGRKDINPSGKNIYSNFIQTDASINPGNSGGPLLNIYGEVIGINAAIAQGTGIGFAIPINMAKILLPQLLEGKISRSWIGVQVQQVTEELADSLGMKRPLGALVVSVVPDGPAAKAGVEPEDVILEFNGKKIEDWSDITWYASTAGVGSQASLKIWRGGKVIKKSLLLAAMPDGEQVASNTDKEQVESKLMGLTVENPSSRQLKKSGIGDGKGVVITSLERTSAAVLAGLMPGDIIRKINRNIIKDKKDFEKVSKKMKQGRVVRMLISRNGNALFVAFRI